MDTTQQAGTTKKDLVATTQEPRKDGWVIVRSDNRVRSGTR